MELINNKVKLGVVLQVVNARVRRPAAAAAAKRLGSVETAVLAPCSSLHRRRRGSGRLLSFSAAKARSCSGSARGGARGAARVLGHET